MLLPFVVFVLVAFVVFIVAVFIVVVLIVIVVVFIVFVAVGFVVAIFVVVLFISTAQCSIPHHAWRFPSHSSINLKHHGATSIQRWFIDLVVIVFVVIVVFSVILRVWSDQTWPTVPNKCVIKRCRIS